MERTGEYCLQQDLSIPDWLRLAGNPEGHLAQPPAQAGPLRARCPVPCPINFETPLRMETPQLPGQPVPALGHPQREKCFLMFREIFLCFHLCPSALALSLGTSEKSLAPSSLHHPFRFLYTWMRTPLSLKDGDFLCTAKKPPACCWGCLSACRSVCLC